MKTIIYYFTGTGNSLWVAKELAAVLGDTELAAMVDLPAGPIATNAQAIGVVFPVHMWGLPHRVLDWAARIAADPGKYYFAAAANAGQVSRTLIQLQEVLAKRGVALAAGADCVLPTNYIPWGGPGPKAKQEARFTQTRARVQQLAETVRAGRVEPVDRGPLWHRVLFTRLYHLSFPHIAQMDKDFWTDDHCNGCGICAKICPSKNIAMIDQKPQWQHRCEQCLACIQWCPQVAVQYGKKTPAYARYHHPAISRAEVMPKGKS
jgi:ferredoxin